MPHIIISLDGNIGAGKSTLLAEIRKQLPEINIVDEPVDQWTYLLDENEKSIFSPSRSSFKFGLNNDTPL